MRCGRIEYPLQCSRENHISGSWPPPEARPHFVTAAAIEVRRKALEAAFRMPSVQTMVSRKSSITNAFVSSIVPVIPPSVHEVEEALAILQMDVEDVRCAYCGDQYTEWDHLRPLVVERRPTGFISEIANLVPSCGKCNQSKGNKPWRVWMTSAADRSPATRKIAGLGQKIARIEAFEKWRSPMRIEFAQIIGDEEWQRYWAMCERLVADMRECQKIANHIRDRIAESICTK